MTQQPSPLTARVSLNIRLAMVERDFNQEQLAAAVGLTGMAISRRLSGQVAIRLTDLESIAAALEVTADDLLRERP